MESIFVCSLNFKYCAILPWSYIHILFFNPKLFFKTNTLSVHVHEYIAIVRLLCIRTEIRVQLIQHFPGVSNTPQC